MSSEVRVPDGESADPPSRSAESVSVFAGAMSEQGSFATVRGGRAPGGVSALADGSPILAGSTSACRPPPARGDRSIRGDGPVARAGSDHGRECVRARRPSPVGREASVGAERKCGHLPATSPWHPCVLAHASGPNKRYAAPRRGISLVRAPGEWGMHRCAESSPDSAGTGTCAFSTWASRSGSLTSHET